MHGMHARLPKHFVLEERLERYRDAIEPDPYHWRGHWTSACAPAGATPFREVRLDLGCGKGSFTVEAARREPDVLFVGMDSEPVCIAYAAQRARAASSQRGCLSPDGHAHPRDVCRGRAPRRISILPRPSPQARATCAWSTRALDGLPPRAGAWRRGLPAHRQPAAARVCPHPSGGLPAIAGPLALGLMPAHALSLPPASTSCASARREPRSSPSLARLGARAKDPRQTAGDEPGLLHSAGPLPLTARPTACRPRSRTCATAPPAPAGTGATA